MNKLIICVVCVLQTACASMGASDFKRSPAAKDTTEMASAECKVKAMEYAGMRNRGLGYGGDYNEMFQACMEAKGFQAQ